MSLYRRGDTIRGTILAFDGDALEHQRHCWSVKLNQSHHNEVLVDHCEWLTRINLGRVPEGVLERILEQ
jgi:hypothetical protein